MAIIHNKFIRYFICYLLSFMLPIIFMPESIKLMAQEEAKEQQSASLNLKTEPEGVEVYLDGEFMGKSPLKLKDLAPKKYKLKLVKEGFQSREELIVLAAGMDMEISLQLDKKEGEKESPKVAVTPAEQKPEVKKGKGWLWLLIGGAAAAAAVALLASKGGKETGGGGIPASGSFGSIQVKSYPPGAAIFLDGQDTGLTTNHTLTNIPTGRHTILLRLAGWKDWREEVDVIENHTYIVAACLLPPNGCFRDNFQDGDADGWLIQGDYSVVQQGGNYILEGAAPHDGSSWIDLRGYDNRYNFTLNFKFKVITYGRGYLMLIMRRGSEGYINLNIGEPGMIFYKYLEVDQKWYVLKEAGPRINPGTWYDIEIVATGGNVQLFIDKRFVMSANYSDNRIQRGYFMFGICYGMQIQIDEVVIISNECP